MKSFLFAGALLTAFTAAPRPRAAAPTAWVDTVLHWQAPDGTPLEGKLSLPAERAGPVPIVFYLHGAGPSTYDRAIRYRDAAGQVQTTRYYDYYARELTARGVGFFRTSKRGVRADSVGRQIVDRSIFAGATPTVLLGDYAAALAMLRRHADVDSTRIVLYGSSEGTRLAPQLATQSPRGIVGLILTSYAADNQRTTVEWQNTIGPWRNVMRLVPGADSLHITRSAYDSAVALNNTLAAQLPFAPIDQDSNGVLTRDELARIARPRLDAIMNAVTTRNDDFLWQNLLNLSSAYLLDGWNGEPTVSFLLKHSLPIGIYHGELDGTTRVEGVREAADAFRAAGKMNLMVRIYPRMGHDLDWTPESASGPGPLPYQESFGFAADLLRKR